MISKGKKLRKISPQLSKRLSNSIWRGIIYYTLWAYLDSEVPLTDNLSDQDEVEAMWFLHGFGPCLLSASFNEIVGEEVSITREYFIETTLDTISHNLLIKKVDVKLKMIAISF